MTVDSIIDEVVGGEFEFPCPKIEIRGRSDHEEPYFVGPGTLSGKVEGSFEFRVFNILEKDPRELIRLAKSAQEQSEAMRLFAEDYRGLHWVGAWFFPKIHDSIDTRCFLTGEFIQLSTGIPLTDFDRERDKTAIFYAGTFRLPMLKASYSQRVRNRTVERVIAHWDRSDLDFNGARVTIMIDEEKDRTTVSTTHRNEWKPPYCEAALSDALAFVSGTNLKPRVAVRYFEEDALVFLRCTPEEPRTGMPRPIGAIPPDPQAFWNLFLSFLKDCEEKRKFDSTRLSRICAELIPASTGTIHGFLLSLVVSIEDLVAQIVGPTMPPTSLEDLINYLRSWKGDPKLKERAIATVGSLLTHESTAEYLRQLAAKNVVTEPQLKTWSDLRHRVAHGELVDYEDEKLPEKRNQLITMFYRLALRLLKYQGRMTDYSVLPPQDFDFRWSS